MLPNSVWSNGLPICCFEVAIAFWHGLQKIPLNQFRSECSALMLVSQSGG